MPTACRSALGSAASSTVAYAKIWYRKLGRAGSNARLPVRLALRAPRPTAELSYASATCGKVLPASRLHWTCRPACGTRMPGAVRYETQTFDAPVAAVQGRSSIGRLVTGLSVYVRPLSVEVETSTLASVRL